MKVRGAFTTFSRTLLSGMKAGDMVSVLFCPKPEIIHVVSITSSLLIG